IRALLLAAARRRQEAREDLRACRRRLGKDDLPTSVTVYNDWLSRANASTAEYLEGTLAVLWQGPAAAPGRQGVAEGLLRCLAKGAAVEREGLKPGRVDSMTAWAHYHLARALAAQPGNRAAVLQHARAALELKVADLTPATFRNDGAIGAWSADKDFKAL